MIRTGRQELRCSTIVTGEKRYIVAPAQVNVGDVLFSGDKADIKPGNAVPLKYIPLGSLIHNVELKVGRGGQLIRSAGAYGQLMAKEEVMLKSGSRQVKCAKYLLSAWRLSGRWETTITKILVSVKLDENGG